MNYHFFTVEKLYHFRCFDCAKWWSVGDWIVTEKMVCPHCGRVAITIEERLDDKIAIPLE